MLILGAGGHAQVVADILLRAYDAGGESKPIGFLDDDPTLSGMNILDLDVLGTISDLDRVGHDAVIVAIGDNRIRARIYHWATSRAERLVNAIHPSAILAPDVRIGQGVMICAGVVVNPVTVLGDNVILNTGCTVDHHNEIGPHAHLGPGVHTGGNVRVGKGAFVGIGSAIIPGRSIGDWSIVGGGAAVVRDIPPSTSAVGVPARAIKHHTGDG